MGKASESPIGRRLAVTNWSAALEPWRPGVPHVMPLRSTAGGPQEHCSAGRGENRKGGIWVSKRLCAKVAQG